MNFDTIYSDIVNKAIPSISSTVGKGLTITKDYVFDLIGRYVKYLIAIDSLQLGINLLLIGIFAFIAWKVIKFTLTEEMQKKLIGSYKDEEEAKNNEAILRVVIYILKGIALIVLFNYAYGAIQDMINLSNNLIKDIFVPEVRIYDIYRSYK